MVEFSHILVEYYLIEHRFEKLLTCSTFVCVCILPFSGIQPKKTDSIDKVDCSSFCNWVFNNLADIRSAGRTLSLVHVTRSVMPVSQGCRDGGALDHTRHGYSSGHSRTLVANIDGMCESNPNIRKRDHYILAPIAVLCLTGLSGQKLDLLFDQATHPLSLDYLVSSIDRYIEIGLFFLSGCQMRTACAVPTSDFLLIVL